MYFKIKRAQKDSAVCLTVVCTSGHADDKRKGPQWDAVSLGFWESYIDKIALTDRLDSVWRIAFRM